MIRIALLFFCSGFAALVYELLWFRQLGFIFGNTVYAATTVLTAYMAGLAIGARWFGRRADRSENPVRLFGTLEILIGVYALLMPVLFLAIRLIYRLLYQNVSESLAVLTPVRFLLAVLVMLVPTIFMGGTLPVLAQGLARRPEKFGTRLSWLYGLNTFGAMTGLLCAGFLLIPNLGLRMSNGVAVAVNLAIGVAAILISRGMTYAPVEKKSTPSSDAALSQRDMRLALAAAGLAGFLALAMEVVWFRALVLIFGSTTYSFCVMLSVFLFGIAAGSVLLGWIGDRVENRLGLFAALLVAVGGYTVYSMYGFDQKPIFLLNYLLEHSFTWASMLQAKMWITLSFLLVPTLLFGFAFTLAARCVRNADDGSGDTVGRVYWFNTLGAVLGSVVGGFVILPRLGIERSLIGLSLVALAGGLLLCLLARPFRRTQLAVAAVAIAAAVLTLVSPPAWDPLVKSSGAFFSPWSFVQNGKLVFWEAVLAKDLLHYEEGLTSTISVARSQDDIMDFRSGGKVEADTGDRSMILQRMQGHLPMLFHPDPRTVLNIGLGAGVTFGALNCYPTDHCEVVEIEPKVKNVAATWAAFNHNVIANPKAMVTIGDGRNHLFCTTNVYDVITADPFEPVHDGAGHLYTVEHYKQARTRLAPGGIMGQFLPMYEMSEEDFFIIMRSFAEAFPNSYLFFTGTDTVILGFNGDPHIDPEAVRKKFEIPEVRASLEDIGFTSPQMILGMFVANLSELLKDSTSTECNTDNHPVIEYKTPRSALKYTTRSNAKVLVDHYTPIPEFFLTGFSPEQVASIQDVHEALRLTLEANVLRQNDRTKEAFDRLGEARELSVNNPVIIHETVEALVLSADSQKAQGYNEQAAYQYHMALTYNPKAFWAMYNLFHLHMMAGREEQALTLLDHAQKVYPDNAVFWSVRAKYAASKQEWDEAVAHSQKAVKAAPARLGLWRQLADYQRSLGNAEGLADAEEQMRRLKSDTPAKYLAN